MNADLPTQTPPASTSSTPPARHWVAWLTRAVVAIVVCVVGFGVAGVLLKTAPQPADIKPVVALQRVSVFEAKQVPVRRQWRGFGVAAALDRADIPARVSATVTDISPTVQAGKPISTTTIIATLDGSDFKQALEQATQRIAELDALFTQIEVERKRLDERLKIEIEDVRLAQTEVDRLAKLLEEDAAKQRELDAAKRMMIIAQRAELATREAIDKIAPRVTAWKALRDAQVASQTIAQQNLDRCTIRSPIEGVLQAVDVKLGESLQPGQRVARVVNLARVEVPVQLPVAARADIVIGGEVMLTASNDTGMCWPAKIVRLSPEDDPATRTMTAYVEVDQKDAAAQFGSAGAKRLLTPGMFVSAVASAEIEEPRWVVPHRSIRSGRLLLVQDGVVASREVRVDYLIEGAVPPLGLPDEHWAVLAQEPTPLSAGELVVLNASVSVRDGDKVEPVVARQDAKQVPVSSPRSTVEKDRGKATTP